MRSLLLLLFDLETIKEMVIHLFSVDEKYYTHAVLREDQDNDTNELHP